MMLLINAKRAVTPWGISHQLCTSPRKSFFYSKSNFVILSNIALYQKRTFYCLVSCFYVVCQIRIHAVLITKLISINVLKKFMAWHLMNIVILTKFKKGVTNSPSDTPRSGKHPQRSIPVHSAGFRRSPCDNSCHPPLTRLPSRYPLT